METEVIVLVIAGLAGISVEIAVLVLNESEFGTVSFDKKFQFRVASASYQVE
jgi:hypothetical protein